MKSFLKIAFLSFFIVVLIVSMASAEQIYTISYDGNGVWLGSTFETQVKQKGMDISLISYAPSVSSTKTFQGWSTDPDATVPEYQPGDLYKKDESVTFYAVWKEPYAIGKISGNKKVTLDVNWSSFSVAESGKYAITTNIVDTYSSRNGIYESPIKNHYIPDYDAAQAYPISMMAELEAGKNYFLHMYNPSKECILSITFQDDALTLSYDGNGVWLGSTFETQVKQKGMDISLISYAPSVSSTKTFQGWSTDPDATVPEYQPGDLYKKDESVTFYAVWKEPYAIGKISGNKKVTLDVNWSSFSVAESGKYAITTNIVDTYSSRNGIYESPIKNHYIPDYDAAQACPISMMAELEAEKNYFLHMYNPSKECILSITFQENQNEISPGDTNSDGTVDMRDALTLLKHLAGWGVKIDMDAANVNGDSAVDMRDALTLLKYLAGWNVTFK